MDGPEACSLPESLGLEEESRESFPRTVIGACDIREEHPGEPDGQQTSSPDQADRQEYLRQLERYASEIHRYVASRVSNSADAEDIAQQTLLLACSKLGTLRSGNVRPWLFGIARHLIVDHYRQPNRFTSLEAVDAGLAEKEPALQTSHNLVPELCHYRERLGCFLCLTRRLRLEHQVAVLLADVHGHRDKDSAAVLGMSVPSFKLLLHEARVRLKELSAGACELVRGPGASTPNPAPAMTAGMGGSATGCACRADEPCAQTVACPLGEDCNPTPDCSRGIRCGRHVPRLSTLRDRLLQALEPSLQLGQS